MCLATVYLDKNGQREEVMHDVAWIKPEGRGLQLITFMGERRTLQAKIKDVDLLKSSIVLEGLTNDPHQMLSDDQQDKNKASRPLGFAKAARQRAQWTTVAGSYTVRVRWPLPRPNSAPIPLPVLI